MAILIHKLRTLNPKKAIACVMLAGMAALIISPISIFGSHNIGTDGNCQPTPASGAPQFNIWPLTYGAELCHDLPLLDAKNVSRGEGWSTSQSDHDAGVQASAGEIIELSVYYHNGVPNLDENVAINTVIRAFANQPPLGTDSFAHTISATIGAQNATTVSSSDVGRGGNISVQIQGGTPLALSLVPGSVILYKDRGLNPAPSPVALPDSVFTSGVNIGTVRGCWEFQGLVNFRLRVSEQRQLAVSLQKTVRNVTDLTAFADQVNADPSDEVEFRLVGTNTGQDIIWHMFMSDQLPAKLTFIPGSIQTSQAIVSGNLFTSSGMDVGQAEVGQSVTVTFRARVADASQFSVGTTVLTNTGTHWGWGPPTPTRTADSTDTAQVVVIKQQVVVSCTFTWSAPVTSDGRGLRRAGDAFNVNEHVIGLSPNTSFNIVHQHVSGSPIFRYAKIADQFGGYVANNSSIIPTTYVAGDYNAFIEVGGVNVAICKGFRIEPPVVQEVDVQKTVGTTTFVEQFDGQPSGRVTFRIIVSSQNSNVVVQNVTLRDQLPAKLTFVSGTLNVNGVPQSEGSFFSTGINIGTLNPGSQITVTFQADIASAANFTVGVCENLVNTATVIAGSMTDQDTATVRVCKQAPTKQPGTPAPRPI